MIYGDGAAAVTSSTSATSSRTARRGRSRRRPYNVGTGEETTVSRAVSASARRSQAVDAEPRFEAARLGDVRRSVLDASLIERELGWRPRRRSPTASADVALDEEPTPRVAKSSGAMDAPASHAPDPLIRPWRTRDARREPASRRWSSCCCSSRPSSYSRSRSPTRCNARPQAAVRAAEEVRRSCRDEDGGGQAVAKLTRARDEGARPERQRPLGRRRTPRPRGSQSVGYRVRRRRRTRTARTTRPRSSCTAPGYRGDALRLAHDLHVKVVGPLDGMSPLRCTARQLAVLLGAR